MTGWPERPPPARPPPPSRLWPWTALSVALAFLGTWVLQSGVLGVRAAGTEGQWFADAVLHYHPSFRAILTGDPLQVEWLYPPFAAVLGAPLGVLPPGAFIVLWGAVQVGALVLLAVVPARRLGHVPWAPAVYLLTLGLAHPVVHNLLWGQVSVLLASLVLSAAALERSGSPATGAALLGGAIAFKYYPAAFLLWWILRRKWRFAGLALAWAAGFSLLPVVLLGPTRFLSVLRQTMTMLGVLSELAPSFYLSQSWVLVLGRVEALTGMPRAFSLELWVPLLLAVGMGAAWAFWRYTRSNRWLAALAIVGCGFPFLDGAIWAHYLVFVPLVQTVALIEVRRLPAGGLRHLLTGLVIVSMGAGSWPVQVATDPVLYSAMGTPFWVTLATLAFLVTAGLVRSSRAGGSGAGCPRPGSSSPTRSSSCFPSADRGDRGAPGGPRPDLRWALPEDQPRRSGDPGGPMGPPPQR